MLLIKQLVQLRVCLREHALALTIHQAERLEFRPTIVQLFAQELSEVRTECVLRTHKQSRLSTPL